MPTQRSPDGLDSAPARPVGEGFHHPQGRPQQYYNFQHTPPASIVRQPQSQGQTPPSLLGSSDAPGRQPVVRQRANISNACSACRRRKRKCLGGTPCHHCQVTNTECIYDQRQDRRRREFNVRQRIEAEFPKKVLDALLYVFRGNDPFQHKIMALIKQGADVEELAEELGISKSWEDADTPDGDERDAGVSPATEQTRGSAERQAESHHGDGLTNSASTGLSVLNIQQLLTHDGESSRTSPSFMDLDSAKGRRRASLASSNTDPRRETAAARPFVPTDSAGRPDGHSSSRLDGHSSGRLDGYSSSSFSPQGNEYGAYDPVLFRGSSMSDHRSSDGHAHEPTYHRHHQPHQSQQPHRQRKRSSFSPPP